MAVAFVQEFEIADRGTSNYDAIAERLNAEREIPDGAICHTAGFDDETGVFRIFDVWESQGQAERFLEERLMPAVREVMGDQFGTPASAPQRQYFYELHDLITR
jgi:hypothetical protein